MGGGSVVLAILSIAENAFERFGHGCEAVAISIIVAPADHTSDARPYPLRLMTSGAIHGTDPDMAFVEASNDVERMP